MIKILAMLFAGTLLNAASSSWFYPGGGGSGPFTPASIAGLQLWYDGQDAVTLGNPANGDPVASWGDKSGFARDASQGTLAFRPIYQATGLNGKPSVKFENTTVPNSYLDAGTGFALLNSAQPFTIFAVLNADSFGNVSFPQFLALSTNTAGNFRFGFGTGLAALEDIFFGVGDGSWDNYHFAFPGGSSITSNFRFTFAYVGSSPTSSASFPTYSAGTPVTISNTISGSLNLQGNFLGSNYQTTNNFNGYIGEIVVYSALLDSTQLGQMNTYLQAKWGF